MSEQPPTVSQVQNSLHVIAQTLRQPGQLTPETQAALAELLDEVAGALQSGSVPSAEMAHLSESTAHLFQALHQRQDAGVLASARDTLEEAIVRADTAHPVVAGLARRLVETLSNLGI
jgi:hypothetical protein